MDAQQRQRDQLAKLHKVADTLIGMGHTIDMINPHYGSGGGTIFIAPSHGAAPIPGAEFGGDSDKFRHWHARFQGVTVSWCEDRAASAEAGARKAVTA